MYIDVCTYLLGEESSTHTPPAAASISKARAAVASPSAWRLRRPSVPSSSDAWMWRSSCHTSKKSARTREYLC